MVNRVLAEAADLSLRNPDDNQKVILAVHCFMLAGKYDSLVSLLNKMILPPNQLDENRGYWINANNDFYDRFMEKRTQVFHELKKTNKLGLMETGRTLVKLHGFFAHLNSSQFHEAWKCIQDLGLIPPGEAELSQIVRTYRMNVDDSIRSCYPAVLLGAMKALYGLHAGLKQDMQGGAGAVVLQRQKELRDQASLLVKFAGLIDMTADEMDRLSQTQALMI